MSRGEKQLPHRGMLLIIIAIVLFILSSFIGVIFCHPCVQECNPCLGWDALNPICQAQYTGCQALAGVCLSTFAACNLWAIGVSSIIQLISLITGVIGIILLILNK